MAEKKRRRPLSLSHACRSHVTRDETRQQSGWKFIRNSWASGSDVPRQNFRYSSVKRFSRQLSDLSKATVYPPGPRPADGSSPPREENDNLVFDHFAPVRTLPSPHVRVFHPLSQTLPFLFLLGAYTYIIALPSSFLSFSLSCENVGTRQGTSK